MHIQDAINSIKINNKVSIYHTNNEKSVQKIVNSTDFEVEKIKCKDVFVDYSDINTFYAVNIVSGHGFVKYNDKQVELKKGDSFLIPATLGIYEFRGELEFLKSYMK